MALWKNSFAVILIALFTYRCLQRDCADEDLTGFLRGKNVVVTGASSGIGEQSALYYASQGANVVVIARREKLLQQLVEKCQALNPSAKFTYIVADFNDVERSEKVMQEAISFLGSIDYLMLNHALILSTPELVTRWTGSPLQYKTMQTSFNVNFLSFMRMASVALPHLKKTSGSICAISSFMVEVPAFTLPYATSKSAVNTFFSGLRQEFIKENVNVSVTIVHLGLVHTDHTKDSLGAMSAAQGRDMERATAILPRTTAERCAKDLAHATVHRASELYYPYNQGLWVVRALRLLISDADYRMAKLENFLSSIGY